jgi:hypothetical protein
LDLVLPGAGCCSILTLRDLDIRAHRTILHRHVRKFTAVTPFRKADLTAHRAGITHAASPMLARRAR